MTANCDMYRECTNPVTHIGEKGYAYCAEHVSCRRGIERCRKMRGWERARLAAGKPLLSYEPITQTENARREREMEERAAIRAAQS